jgi:hypothetical protein
MMNNLDAIIEDFSSPHIALVGGEEEKPFACIKIEGRVGCELLEPVRTAVMEDTANYEVGRIEYKDKVLRVYIESVCYTYMVYPMWVY